MHGGIIAEHRAVRRRQFPGNNLLGYLMRRVLGGSSVFRVGGWQLPGMLDRSQLSADPRGRILREAFVVRARTIGQNLAKLPGRLVARMEEIEQFNLQWFRDRVGVVGR